MLSPEVAGIRFRDLADCAARALVWSCAFEDDDPNAELRRRAEDGTLNYNDLVELDLDKMDPLALIQNLGCEVGKAMGILPNIPTPEA